MRKAWKTWMLLLGYQTYSEHQTSSLDLADLRLILQVTPSENTDLAYTFLLPSCVLFHRIKKVEFL